MELRNITYYKTKKTLSFNDGFEVPEGTKVQFNFAEGQLYNVQLKKHNEKRIFWVHVSELTLYKSVKEKWLKKDIEEHNIDLNDKWFEYEKQKLQSKNTAKPEGATSKTVKRTKSAAKKKTTGRNSKTGNPARIPSKKGKAATKKRRNSKTTTKK